MKKLLALPLKQRLEACGSWGDALERVTREDLCPYIERALVDNPWFTEGGVRHALHRVCEILRPQLLEEWVARYELDRQQEAARVGLIMASNIPLVGFHDLLCVLISGQRAYLRPSDRDTALFHLITDRLLEVCPDLKPYLFYVDRLGDVDALMATGRDETMAHFERYFGHLPHLFRGARSSCAILSGKETQQELADAADDAFLYFGLGCRSISKLYLPQGYDLSALLNAWKDKYMRLEDHHRYMNHYIYQRALCMMGQRSYVDASFFVLLEDKGLSAPPSVVFYEWYEDIALLVRQLEAKGSELQCVYASEGIWEEARRFGTAQSPALDDYADGVDTMRFLERLPHFSAEERSFVARS